MSRGPARSPCGSPRRRHTSTALSAPACSGIAEHRVRAIARDTGGGFGQKIFVLREEMCIMLAAPKLPAALKWIEDRQENLRSAGRSRHEHADVRMAFDDDGMIRAVAPRLRVRTRGRIPHPGRRCLRRWSASSSPGPTGCPWPASAALRLHQHRRAARGTEGLGSTRRSLGRSSSRSPPDGWASTRSSCAAGTCCGATRCRTPTRTACRYDCTSPMETFEQAVAMLDYGAFRHEQAAARAGRAVPRCRLLQLRRTDHTVFGYLRDRGLRPSA